MSTDQLVTAGIDVGSAAVKVVVMQEAPGDPAGHRILSSITSRIRKREVAVVAREAFDSAVASAGVEEIADVATTGDGEEIPFATGHFYGMTTHARGALFLEPRARAVLDVGALHARAVGMDERGRVLGYKMTSQCASGSGQFLENIARYLGVSQAEIGALSLAADDPESVSSICAVLAETDVINMVSRGLTTSNILRGIHESMAGRFARLLTSLGATGVVFVSGGLASDEGLRGALISALTAAQKKKGIPLTPESAPAGPIEVVGHENSIVAGAIGAAIWGAYRYRKLGLGEPAWRMAAVA